jgi:hypothetical protein
MVPFSGFAGRIWTGVVTDAGREAGPEQAGRMSAAAPPRIHFMRRI